MANNGIEWPQRFYPQTSAVHVINSLHMDASSEAVWNCLIRAPAWPTWYSNASNVVLPDATSDTLELGTRFRWQTFGVTVECTVEEFQPAERLAWSSESFAMSVYHAWRISPTPQGCHVLTEETQNGIIPRIGKLSAPGRMHKFHQIWLDQLNEVAKGAA